MKIYDNLGNLLQKDYNYKNAIERNKEYLEHAEYLNDSTHIIKALNKIANNYSQINGYNEASEYIFKALRVIDSYGDENPCIKTEKAAILRNLGYIYLIGIQTEDAFNCLEESLKLEQLTGNNEGEAKTLLYLGKLFEQNNQYDSAYQFYTQSLDRNIKLNSVSGISENYNHIGNLFMTANDFDGAKVYLESSYNIINNTSDKLNKLKACLSLGGFNTKTGNFNEAKKNLSEGLKISKELKMPAYLEKSHHLLSELYEKEGKSSLALSERILSDNYGYEYRRERSINRILQLRLEYENDLYEKEKQEIHEQYLATEEQNKKTIKASVSIILVLIVLIFSIVKYFSLQKNKNDAVYQLEMLKSGFFSNISQEYKTPISIIHGVVEKLRNNLDIQYNDNIVLDLEVLLRQTKNLRLLTNGISSVSKLREVRKPSEEVNGNIIAYLKYLFDSFKVLSEIKKIEYEFKTEIDELNLEYIPEYIRLIMNNLLSRTFSHSSHNDNITVFVGVDKLNKNYKIQISNTGSLKIKSTDFDISITKEIVYRLKGSFDKINDSENTTTFIITLPVVNERRKSLQKSDNYIGDSNLINPEDNSILLPIIEYNNDKPTILVVENNIDLNYYLTSILKDKYNVVVEYNIENAINSFREIKPDIIISDIIFSHSSGYALCKEIRTSKNSTHTPIVLISRTNSKEERVLSIKNGADAFISLPIYETELTAILERLLKQKKSINENTISISSIKKSIAEEGKLNNSDTDFLHRVTDIIYKEITNTENIIEIISSEMCLSSSQLNRKIKSIAGVTTSNYILNVRLNKAKKQLTVTQKLIGEIAMECGFNDFAYFSRSFKKRFGITPTTVQKLQHSLN